MGFIGTLVVHRGDADIGELLAAHGEAEAMQERGPWHVTYLDAELVGADARPFIASVCERTDAPALSAFIFESDCAFISMATPGSTPWSTCLVRAAVAGLDSLDHDEMNRKYGSPEQSVVRARDWSQAAGLMSNASALLMTLAFEDSDEIFLGLKCFDWLLAGLGLAASDTPGLWETPPN